MPAAERRQYPRLSVNIPFTLVVPGFDKPIRGHLRDISQGGCFFTTEPVLDRSRRISVDFVVLPKSICNATGRVVRENAGQEEENGYGVEFGAINPELQQFVAELGSAPEERRNEYLARVLDPEIHVA
jgi:c-di-GMP-binding flagellar brake protein YcgR